MKHKCLNPHCAWLCGLIRSKADGVISPHLVFSPKEAEVYFRKIAGDAFSPLMAKAEKFIPCGKCAACKIRSRKEWSVRLSHECQHWRENCCFITLTYDDEHLPVTDWLPIDSENKKVQFGLDPDDIFKPTLLVSHVQKFIKRLRRHLEYVPVHSKFVRDHVDHIRYYAVGEYGSRTGRPHYHLIIFGWRPSDMVYFKDRNGHAICRSAQIEKLWRFGFSTVQEVKGNVAAYCSRYVTKKFARLNDDGNPFNDSVFPEFMLQSIRDGGIGATWFDENYEAMVRRGFATVRTGTNFVKVAIPKYYMTRLRRKDLALWLQLRDEKITFLKSHKIHYDDFDDLVRSVACYQKRERDLFDTDYF